MGEGRLLWVFRTVDSIPIYDPVQSAALDNQPIILTAVHLGFYEYAVDFSSTLHWHMRLE